jgi:hypothetical protein
MSGNSVDKINKIEFAIFRFFYDFLGIFTKISKCALLSKIRFCTEAPRKI